MGMRRETRSVPAIRPALGLPSLRAAVESVVGRARAAPAAAMWWIAGWVRFVALALMVWCARFAPGAVTRAASAGARLIALSPMGRGMLAEAEWFGLTSEEAGPWVRRRWWTRCRRAADLALFANRRDELDKWRVVDVDGERVHETVRAGRPLIIAFPHMNIGLLVPVGAHLGASRGLVGVWPPPAQRFRGWAAEQRMLHRLLVRALAGVNGAVAGTDGAAGPSLVRELRRPGTVLGLAVDVCWGDGASHLRPFMGHPEWAFHPGPARLARLAQCPIVLCVPIRTAERELTIHWGPFIEPAGRGERAADAQVTDQLTERLEEALTLHGSEQYLYPMAPEGGRRWDREVGRWEAAPSRVTGHAKGE
jgi:lauroyl/myristoyl acyltransferase